MNLLAHTLNAKSYAHPVALSHPAGNRTLLRYAFPYFQSPFMVNLINKTGLNKKQILKLLARRLVSNQRTSPTRVASRPLAKRQLLLVDGRISSRRSRPTRRAKARRRPRVSTGVKLC